MTKIFALFIALALSFPVLLTAAANDAAGDATGKPQVQQGETTAVQSMKDFRAREKKRSELKKKAAEKRQALKEAATSQNQK